jgi:lipopolysaccharide transport system ATP-binding protein
MKNAVIEVENLGKRYQIWHKGTANDSLREVVMTGVRSAATRPRSHFSRQPRLTPGTEEFWALRDVSFQVPRGEVLGLIGRNGAGKSTLLKLLSRITEPTTGRFGLRGRVSSLLEVGTGFHPELSGRENIFLNGAILGMKRSEIRRKFDTIVAFSEIEKFLDTPVKRYSSGMYVRLAFAVAAHLEPEILIVDEVLAVGDVAFQKKCLGRMSEVAKEDRTVLFVSHNMQAVQHLCSRAILLQRGQVLEDGPVTQVVRRYHEELRSADLNANTAVGDEHFRRGTGAARLHNIQIQDTTGQERQDFQMGETIRFGLSYRVLLPIPNLWAAVVLRSGSSGEFVTTARHMVSSGPLAVGQEGSLIIEWPSVNLRPGEYPLYFWLGDHEPRAFDVVDRLVGPLRIGTEDSFDKLGFDPSIPSGYFSIASQVVDNHMVPLI